MVGWKLTGRHLIYLSQPVLRNAGGPSGYTWHLWTGIKEVQPDAPIDLRALDAWPAGRASFLAKYVDALKRLDFAWRFLRSTLPNSVKGNYSSSLRAPEEYNIDLSVAGEISEYESIHCHTTHDLVSVHNALVKIGKREKVKLYLTSHCPEIPAREIADNLFASGLTRAAMKKAYERLLKVDEAAFRAADLLIFPSSDALDPYRETYRGFDELIAGKEVQYLLTGLVDVTERASEGKFEFPGEGLKLLFVGRHNSVKGYDLLAAAVPGFLSDSGAKMFVAGRQGPMFSPDHPDWHEIGWISNPYPLISFADVFVLPNRRTYFDLVALEVMALGKVIVASATGGNKTLGELSEGVILFEPSEAGLKDALNRVQSLGAAELKRLGSINRHVYEQKLSAPRFAENYLRIVFPRGVKE